MPNDSKKKNMKKQFIVKYKLKTDNLDGSLSSSASMNNSNVISGVNRVNRNNMGFKLGCGAEYNKLYLELGYQFGITNIWDSDAITGHNNALFLNFGVNF